MADPAEAASAAGLRYVSDTRPGFGRRRVGTGFSYTATDGQTIRDPAVLRRIRALAVPPAWTDVWICPSPNGHIQATGRDARGRKQYRYHERFREVRDAGKYERLIAFGEALPRIRQRTTADLGQRGMPREKVLAAVVQLLDQTSIRIGNEEYRRQNKSFGLTTLRNRHAHLDGSTVRFEFVGKGGKLHRVSLQDRRLARVIKQCQELPGQELFQYMDEDGLRRNVESDDVNTYLREISGGDFSAKDFRTWNGTVLALRYLRVCEPSTSVTAGKRQLTQAIKSVAEALGNTVAVCRKAYVHPVVVNSYLEGSLEPEAGLAPTGADEGLSEEEQCVLSLLRSRAELPTAA
jgi:DNA topoisomerase I